VSVRLFRVRDPEVLLRDAVDLDGEEPPLLLRDPDEARQWESRESGLRYLTHEQLGRYIQADKAGRSHADAVREALAIPAAVNQ
jgi:hypothetical protein